MAYCTEAAGITVNQRVVAAIGKSVFDEGDNRILVWRRAPIMAQLTENRAPRGSRG